MARILIFMLIAFGLLSCSEDKDDETVPEPYDGEILSDEQCNELFNQEPMQAYLELFPSLSDKSERMRCSEKSTNGSCLSEVDSNCKCGGEFKCFNTEYCWQWKCDKSIW